MAATRNSILQGPTCGGGEEEEGIWQNRSQGTNFQQAFFSSAKVFPRSLLNVRNHPKTGLKFKLRVLFRTSGILQDFLNITQQAVSRSESHSISISLSLPLSRPKAPGKNGEPDNAPPETELLEGKRQHTYQHPRGGKSVSSAPAISRCCCISLRVGAQVRICCSPVQ